MNYPFLPPLLQFFYPSLFLSQFSFFVGKQMLVSPFPFFLPFSFFLFFLLPLSLPFSLSLSLTFPSFHSLSSFLFFHSFHHFSFRLSCFLFFVDFSFPLLLSFNPPLSSCPFSSYCSNPSLLLPPSSLGNQFSPFLLYPSRVLIFFFIFHSISSHSSSSFPHFLLLRFSFLFPQPLSSLANQSSFHDFPPPSHTREGEKGEAEGGDGWERRER